MDQKIVDLLIEIRDELRWIHRRFERMDEEDRISDLNPNYDYLTLPGSAVTSARPKRSDR